MIPLSNVLDNYFRKKILIILSLTLVSATLGIVTIGFLKSNNELKSTLEMSSSIYSSILYSKDWDLLNKFSSVQLRDDKLHSIKIESKENSKVLYSFSNDENFFMPVRCRRNSDSELIRIEICKNIIGADYLAYSLLGIFLFAGIVYAVYSRSKRKAVLFFNSLSESIDKILSNESPSFQSYDIKELFELQKSVVDSSSKIKRLAKTAAIVDFSRKVAHDLRSPAAIIDMCTGHEKLTKEDLELIKSAANRIKNISSGLLDQSRHKNPLPCKSRLDVREHVKALIKEKKCEFAEFNFSLEIEDLLGCELLLWVNPFELSRVISNILSNSIEETCKKSDAAIIIRLHLLDHNLVIDVIDNGHGFPKEVLQSFRDGEFISTKEKGNALGLQSARDFMINQGGSLTLNENTPQGARVTLVFPNGCIIKKEDPIVQIDDDKYIRLAWMRAATISNIKLLSFASLDDFLVVANDIPFSSEVFIDYNLGNKTNGNEVSKKLYQKGYVRISLATGESFGSKMDTEHLNNIIGKKFPY